MRKKEFLRAVDLSEDELYFLGFECEDEYIIFTPDNPFFGIKNEEELYIFYQDMFMIRKSIENDLQKEFEIKEFLEDFERYFRRALKLRQAAMNKSKSSGNQYVYPKKPMGEA